MPEILAGIYFRSMIEVRTVQLFVLFSLFSTRNIINRVNDQEISPWDFVFVIAVVFVLLSPIGRVFFNFFFFLLKEWKISSFFIVPSS